MVASKYQRVRTAEEAEVMIESSDLLLLAPERTSLQRALDAPSRLSPTSKSGAISICLTICKCLAIATNRDWNEYVIIFIAKTLVRCLTGI